MKLLRSITRRGFNIGTAGWFTVLKPNTWFPASRLPESFRYRNNESGATTAGDHAGSRETTSPRIMIPATIDRRVMRPALIVLSAMIVTSGLLWWIMHP